MEQIMNYIQPELVVVAIVLYFLGIGLKQAQSFEDKHIPVVLGAVGILLSALYVFATTPVTNVQEGALAIFTSIVQGVLVAGLSTYVNQIFKQLNKEE